MTNRSGSASHSGKRLISSIKRYLKRAPVPDRPELLWTAVVEAVGVLDLSIAGAERRAGLPGGTLALIQHRGAEAISGLPERRSSIPLLQEIARVLDRTTKRHKRQWKLLRQNARSVRWALEDLCWAESAGLEIGEVMALLRLLSDDEQNIIRLRVIEGLTIAQISDVLDLPPHRVRTLVTQAVHNLLSRGLELRSSVA